jgi:hypothetical protein
VRGRKVGKRGYGYANNKCEEDVAKLEREVVKKIKAMEIKLGIPSREIVATEAS